MSNIVSGNSNEFLPTFHVDIYKTKDSSHYSNFDHRSYRRYTEVVPCLADKNFAQAMVRQTLTKWFPRDGMLFKSQSDSGFRVTLERLKDRPHVSCDPSFLDC